MEETKESMDYSEKYIGKLGELTLKGSNEHFFEKQLVNNLRLAFEGINAKTYTRSGRLYVSCTKESCPGVEYALDRLIGITGWAKVMVVEKNIDAIKKGVVEIAQKASDAGAKSFKIETKREDKDFPLNSYQISAEAAGGVFDSGMMKVDLHHPDVVIHVEVRTECLIYSDQKRTCRGLPVGVSGKGLLLLSGGIDSPVAGYRMMRRGMKVECAYFHSYPYTSEEAQKKVEDLARIIADYGVETHLNVIPFTEVQMKIKQKAPKEYTTLMLRLCMMKTANILAKRISADCIITGESLGQVASQTVENLRVTESFAELPLIRPLIGMDKEDIVDVANEIGTFNTSILPYEDCCVLFSPKHPVLKAKIEDAQQIYKEMEIDELIEKAFDERKIFRYGIRETVGEKFATREFKSLAGECTGQNRDGLYKEKL